MTQHRVRGHLSLTPYAGRQVPGFTGPQHWGQPPLCPPSVACIRLFFPKVPHRQASLAVTTGPSDAGPPSPLGPGDNCPFLKESPTSLAAARSC